MKLSKGKAGKLSRTVTLAIDFWKDAKGLIHFGTNDKEGGKFAAAIAEDPTKLNGHPTLYRKLDAILKRKGAFDVTAS